MFEARLDQAVLLKKLLDVSLSASVDVHVETLHLQGQVTAAV